MNHKPFTTPQIIIFILALAVVVGGYLAFGPKAQVPQPQGQNLTSTIVEVDTTDWQTYRNEKYGFEFEYPAGLETSSSGPNEEQKKLERGETISGTVPPSYDTITFSNSAKKEQFNVVISPNKVEVSPAGFSGYLSMGSVCDTRWIDSVSDGPTLLNKNGIPILEVQVIFGGPRGGSSAGCYYLKNSDGNLIVFNISGFESKSDFLNVFRLVGDQILSTFKFIEPK